MPKEIFKYKHDGHYIVGETAGEEVNLKLAWSKPEGDTLGAVLLQVGDGQGGFGPSQIIGDTENVEELDRLIAALKRARRAVLAAK